jgi:Family of unknown function (DUF5761)
MLEENCYEKYGNVTNILDMKSYNGRVNVMEEEDADVKFKMYERTALKNKANGYSNPLDGILENNILAQVYFSSGNEQILQNGIRAGVYKMSSEKFVVSQQNSDQLKIIMRSIYLQFAVHEKDNITSQVEALNKRVFAYCIPYVYAEAESYVKYLKDQSTLVVPLERSMQPDRDFKQLQYKVGL